MVTSIDSTFKNFNEDLYLYSIHTIFLQQNI